MVGSKDSLARLWRPGALAVGVALATGCSTGCTPPEPEPIPELPSALEFQSCTSGALPEGLATVDWNRSINDIVTLGSPHHSAQDILTATTEATLLAGKFSYGSVFKDLEGERIEVWVDDCAGGYLRVGERTTDSDGRISLPLTSAQLPTMGEYGVYFRVMGDNSAARSILRVYPPQTQFIVFDIDATLTTGDSELVGQVVTEILSDGSVPDAREGAVDIVRLRHEVHGYELVFLTGRPYLLDGLTRAWLVDLAFPPGTVHLTDDVADSWPSDSAVGAFKANFLQTVIDNGFTIHAAYGNATSDIFAYEQIGVAKERTFILDEHGGESGTVALGDGYTEHIAEIQGETPADQPFQR